MNKHYFLLILCKVVPKFIVKRRQKNVALLVHTTLQVTYSETKGAIFKV